MWMAPFLRLMPSAMSDKDVRGYLEGKLETYVMKIERPFRSFDWCEFISKAKDFFKGNFLPFVLLLSGGVAAFHYQKVLSCVGKKLFSIFKY